MDGRLQGEQADVIEFLREENRLLKASLPGGVCVPTTTSAGASLSWAIGLVDDCSGRSRRS